MITVVELQGQAFRLFVNPQYNNGNEMVSYIHHHAEAGTNPEIIARAERV